MNLASRTVFAVLFITIFSHLIITDTNALEFSVSSKAAEHTQHAQGELIIEIKRGIIELGKEKGVVPKEKVSVKSESIELLNTRYGLINIERLFSGTRKDEPSDIYLFRFSSTVNIKELASVYREDSDVIYAEPNYRAHILNEKE